MESNAERAFVLQQLQLSPHAQLVNEISKLVESVNDGQSCTCLRTCIRQVWCG
jgi:hypothetical protein